jgi:hypothetical protein
MCDKNPCSDAQCKGHFVNRLKPLVDKYNSSLKTKEQEARDAIVDLFIEKMSNGGPEINFQHIDFNSEVQETTE